VLEQGLQLVIGLGLMYCLRFQFGSIAHINTPEV